MDADPTSKTLRSSTPPPGTAEDNDDTTAPFFPGTSTVLEQTVKPVDEAGIWRFVAWQVLEHGKKLDDLEGLWNNYIRVSGCKYSATHINTHFKESMCTKLYKAEGLTKEQILQLYKQLQLPIDGSVEPILELKFRADIDVRDGHLYSYKFWSTGENGPAVETKNVVIANKRVSTTRDDSLRNGRMPKPKATNYTTEEEVQMWNYLFDLSGDSPSFSPKGRQVWWEYVKSGRSDRSADGLLSHYRMYMQKTLHMRPVEKKKVLELYRIFQLPMDKNVQSKLEAKFNVKIEGVDEILVSYKERSAQNVATDDVADPSITANVSQGTPEDVGDQIKPDSTYDDDDRVERSRYNARYTFAEEAQLWNYLYEFSRSSPLLPRTPFYHGTWNKYVVSTQCQRTCTALAQHYRLFMQHTLHKHPIEKQKMLELFKRLELPMSEHIQATLEKKFDVNIKRVNKTLVSYSDRNSVDVKEDVDDTATIRAEERRDTGEDVAEVEHDSDDRRIFYLSRKRKAHVAALSVISAAISEPSGSPGAKRAPSLAEVKERDAVMDGRMDTTKVVGDKSKDDGHAKQPAITTSPMRPERSLTTTTMPKSLTSSQNCMSALPNSTTTTSKAPAVTKPLPTSQYSVTSMAAIDLKPDFDVVDQMAKDDDICKSKLDEFESSDVKGVLPDPSVVAGGASSRKLAAPLPSTGELDTSSDDVVIIEPSYRQKIPRMVLEVVDEPASTPRMTPFLKAVVSMFATFGLNLKEMPAALQAIANDEINVVKQEGEGTQWAIQGKLFEKLQKGERSFDEYVKKVKAELMKAKNVVKPVGPDEMELHRRVIFEHMALLSQGPIQENRVSYVFNFDRGYATKDENPPSMFSNAEMVEPKREVRGE